MSTILPPRPKVVNMKHITVGQRYQTEAYLKAAFQQKEIAEITGKSESAISREIKRNKMFNGIYKAQNAQGFYKYARKNCRKKSKLQPEVLTFVEDQLKEDKSPEQITGIMRKNKMSAIVSHETIYQRVWDNKRHGGPLHKHLRNRGRRYRKRGSLKDKRGIITGRIGIEKRPAIVDEKARVGDVEIDLVIGKNYKYPVLTVVERKSGMAWIRKMADKPADAVEKELIDILLSLKGCIQTITSTMERNLPIIKPLQKSSKPSTFLHVLIIVGKGVVMKIIIDYSDNTFLKKLILLTLKTSNYATSKIK